MKKIIADIFCFVRNHGTLTNKAQSAWGADRWEYECHGEVIAVTLEDDGYTQGVFATSVKARHTEGRDVVFKFGDEQALKDLYKVVNNSIEEWHKE